MNLYKHCVYTKLNIIQTEFFLCVYTLNISQNWVALGTSATQCKNEQSAETGAN
jgi:hypothetical protein